jgi:hypothetical protein
MNLITNTLTNNFITYTPFSSHLNFLFFTLHGEFTKKKARSFCRPGFLFDTCLFTVTYKYNLVVLVYDPPLSCRH